MAAVKIRYEYSKNARKMPKIKAAEKVFELRIPINLLIYSRALEWICRFSLPALHLDRVGLPAGKKVLSKTTSK